jgi:MFS family permease
MPLGYLMGMVLALLLRDQVGWRGVFYITGSIGVLLSFVIFFFVREAPRGKSEPELANLAGSASTASTGQSPGPVPQAHADPLFIRFFGVFPGRYFLLVLPLLQTERGYSDDAVLPTMGSRWWCWLRATLSAGASGTGCSSARRAGG